MSAYICTPEHIATLAACFIRSTGNSQERAQEVAGQLMAANIASVSARYPKDTDGNRPGPGGYSDLELVRLSEEIAGHYYNNPPKVSTVELLAYIQCLDYQACEVDDYDRTDCSRILSRMINHFVGLLPGIAGCWEFSDTQTRRQFERGAK